MRKTNTNKGITLIALVITIIVMLILVAVTITMAVNGGLFEYARNAGTKTNAAVDAEQEFANLEADMTVDELIDKYTEWPEDEVISGGESAGGDEATTITFTIDGTSYTAGKDMTWRDWITSPDYNSGDCSIFSGAFVIKGPAASENTRAVSESVDGMAYPVGPDNNIADMEAYVTTSL